MTFLDKTSSRAAIAALLALPLAAGSVAAQQSQDSGAQDSGDQTDQTDAAGQTDAQAAGNGQAQTPGDDTVVATVSGTDIMGSDVLTVIGMLPPQIQSQPREMLVPMAMEQLIMRELILEQARSENLAEDPEVIALVDGSMRGLEEDALVQVWIDREMADVVTDEAVQQVYSDLQERSEQDVPPLAEVRPQIEQFLRQQAMQAISGQLRQGADIVLYDASGRPMQQDAGAADGTSGGQSGDDSTGSDSAGTGTGGGNGSDSDGDSEAGTDSSGRGSATSGSGQSD